MVTLYSNDCPNCIALKADLDRAGLSYNVCSDIDTMIGMGLNELPVLEVNGELLNRNEAITWIKKGTKA